MLSLGQRSTQAHKETYKVILTHKKKKGAIRKMPDLLLSFSQDHFELSGITGIKW